MITALQIVGGLLLLFFGGEFLVRGAVALARRLGVSPLIIGLSVVAAGTSAPELVVSLFAALEDRPGIAVGNVVGSNIANILLVLGTAAVIHSLVYGRRTAMRDGGVLVGATLILTIICLWGTIERWHGAVILVLMLGYLGACYLQDRRNIEAQRELEAEVKELEKAGASPLIITGLLVLGFGGVIVGSDQLIEGAVDVAVVAGVSDTVIGVTLVAVGTSLPELAAAIAAARAGHTEIAVGNAVGSCIFNLLAILGTVAVVVPLSIPPQILVYDWWVMLGVTLLFVLTVAVSQRLTRSIGIAALCLYAVYVATQFAGWSAMPAMAH